MFWVSAKTDYQTCSIFVYNTYGALNGTCENCVDSISLSPMPAVGVSKLTVVTPSVALTDNDSIAADRLKNYRLFWEIRLTDRTMCPEVCLEFGI